MDPLTQGLLGASAGMALFHRSLGRGAAAVAGFAGVIADLDVAGGFFLEPLDAMIYHRHATHSLLFIPIGALLGALPFLWVKAWRLRRRHILGAALVGYASHPLLDACTAYGTPLFWPISSERVAFDIISIIDPLFTLILALGLGVALWRERAVAVNTALVIAGFYLAMGFVQHERAMDAQARIVAHRGQAAQRGRVMPTLGNLIVWRSIYEANGHLYVDGLRLGIEPAWLEGEHTPKLDHTEWAGDRHAEDRLALAFERFAWFSDGYVGRLEDARLGIVAGDLRYSMQLGSITPIWAIAIEGAAETARPIVVEPDVDRQAALRTLWQHLWSASAFEPVPVPAGVEAVR